MAGIILRCKEQFYAGTPYKRVDTDKWLRLSSSNAMRAYEAVFGPGSSTGVSFAIPTFEACGLSFLIGYKASLMTCIVPELFGSSFDLVGEIIEGTQRTDEERDNALYEIMESYLPLLLSRFANQSFFGSGGISLNSAHPFMEWLWKKANVDVPKNIWVWSVLDCALKNLKVKE